MLPAITPAAMGQVDRIVADELGLDLAAVMEVAGRATAAFARGRFLAGDPRGRRVLVLAGGGGNGGDGLVAARWLHGWGAEVAVWSSQEPSRLRGLAARQMAVVARLELPVAAPLAAEGGEPRPIVLPPADLLIDALLGFGAAGPPTGAVADLIRAAAAHPAPILAVDLPSGLDGGTGTPHPPSITATATLTLALPKTGLLAPAARQAVGELHVADIGIPAAAFARVGLAVGPLFAEREVARLW